MVCGEEDNRGRRLRPSDCPLALPLPISPFSFRPPPAPVAVAVTFSHQRTSPDE